MSEECPHCGTHYPEGTYGGDVLKARQELQEFAERSNAAVTNIRAAYSLLLIFSLVIGFAGGLFIGMRL